MPKIDLKRELKELYTAKAEPAVVDVPPLACLMIDGAGDPNTAPEYKAAVEALYALSYALKFRLKREVDRDYAVLPLEELWWTDDMAQFSMDRRDEWQWTMLIVQPVEVTQALFETAGAETARKKTLPALDRVRHESLDEGRSAQVLHLGPYADEPPTIARLHSFIHEAGYLLSGKHHEIYLSDLNRAAPEKLRTIIRQPIAPHRGRQPCVRSAARGVTRR